MSLHDKMEANYNCFSCATLQTVERTGIVLVQLFCAGQLLPCLLASHAGNPTNITAIMTMRVYALYEKSRCIIATLSAVIAGVLGFSIVRLVAQGTWLTLLT